MKPRTAGLVVATICLTITWFGTPTTAQTPCDPTAPTAVTNVAAKSNLADTTWTCRTVRIHGDLTLPAGKKLTIKDSVVLFDAPGGRPATMRIDGVLTIENSTFSPNTTAFRTGRWYLAATSSASIVDSAFSDYDGFNVNSSKVSVRASLFQDPTATGIQVNSGRPELVDVDILNGQTGIRTEGTSAPWINLTHVDGALGHALTAAGTSRPVLTETDLCSGLEALHATAGSDVRMTLGGFCQGQSQQVRLLTVADSSPKVDLRGVPFDPAKVQRDTKAWFNTSWLVEVNVDPDTPEHALHADMDSIKIVLRNATGFQVDPQITGEDDVAGPFLVPHKAQGPTGTKDYNTGWTVLASKHSSSGTAAPQPIAENQLDAAALHVTLVIDDDAAKPTWPSATPLRQIGATPGFSNETTVRLDWDAADDTVDGEHPNRNIQLYQVSQSSASTDTFISTTATELNITKLAAGTYRFKVRALDLAGNAGDYSNEVTVAVDAAKPTITFTTNRTKDLDAQSFRLPFNVTFRATDPATIESLKYRIEAGALQPYTKALDFVEEGTYNVTIVAKDRAGNTNETRFKFSLDNAAPQILASFTPAVPDGRQGWYTHAPNLVASAFDGGSGIHDIRYKVGSGTWTTYTKSLNITAQGQSLITIEARDRSNNNATTTLLLRHDSSPPKLTAAVNGTKGSGVWYKGSVDVEVKSTDEASGVDSLSFRLGEGSWNAFQSPLHLDFTGSQKLLIRATDRAGNPSTETSLVLALDGDAPIPPLPRWRADDRGIVYADWTRDPPLDLASGIGAILVEQADAQGLAARSFTTAVDNTTAAVGPFQAGSYRFRVTVSDVAGNTAHSAWNQVTVHSSVGGLLSIDDVTKVRGDADLVFTPTLNFTPAEVLYYVDDELVAALGEGPFEVQWDSATVADGTHTIKIVARDHAGNQEVQSMTYDVRNGYGHAIADNPVPFGLATVVGVSQVGGAFYVWRRWRTL